MRLFLLLFSLGFVSQSSGQSIYYVRFPNDTIIEQCSNPGYLTNGPQFYNPDSLNLAVESDYTFWGQFVPACFSLERSWKIYDVANYDSTKPCIKVPNPILYLPVMNPLNFQGPVVSPINTPGFYWSATESRISISDTVPVNFSAYWDVVPNCYQYIQIIYVNDTIGPTWINCPANVQFFPDTTANDPDLWNDPDFPGNADLPETPVDLSVQAFDSCAGSNCTYSYRLFLDLDQDSIAETVVPLANNLPAGNVRFDNINTPNYSGGELRVFDNRPVLPAQRYVFSLERQFDSSGTWLGAFLRWRYWQDGKWKLAIPQLPPGNHYIEWFAGDACGNDISCKHPFTVSAVVPAREIPDAASPNCLSNTPNPFREQTTLRFNLPLGGTALLAIHDLNGHLLWSSSGLFNAGDQQVLLNSAMTGHASGLLRFSVQTAQGSASRLLLALPQDR